MARLLDDPKLPEQEQIELLRAAREYFEPMKLVAGAAFARLSAKVKDPDARYLLCEPAASLARLGDARALAYLWDRIEREDDPMVRAKAVEQAGRVPELKAAIAHASEDQNPRVRDAATRSLGGSSQQTDVLVRRLLLDDFTFVRGHAAEALAEAGVSELADRVLAQALSDKAPWVRARAAKSLGDRKAITYAPLLRELADDPAQPPQVRVRSVYALGRLCDSQALSLLTALARRAEDPYAPGEMAELGLAAIGALGHLHPRDLAERLQPLLESKHAPRHVRAAAKDALRPQGNACAAAPNR